MSELRWILIGFGIVLLAGIYLWGRRGAAAPDGAGRLRTEPPLQAGESLDAGEIEPVPADDGFEATAPQGDEMARMQAAPSDAAVASTTHAQDARRGRVEPTFNDTTPTDDLPTRPDAAPAPTLSSSEAAPPRRIERRKILSVRLSAAPQRLDGSRLLEVLQSESLQHGKYNVFHRLHEDGASIFSVASMVEPGTFELETMADAEYPGVTLFAQLPGPVPGMHALNELVACARRLQQSLGGTLQDDRGVPLTVHRIERLREEVREFERPGGGRGGSTAHLVTP